jgi:hypothetical protein
MSDSAGISSENLRVLNTLRTCIVMIQILKKHMKHVQIMCSETEVQWIEYLIQDGLFFKGCQLCIPKCSMRDNMLKEKHSGGLAGHFDHEKTFS